MDYIFYQVAAINGFDSFGHYLRAGLIVNQCATYAITPGVRLLGELPESRPRRRRPARPLDAPRDPVLQRTAQTLAEALGLSAPEAGARRRRAEVRKRTRPAPRAPRRTPRGRPAPQATPAPTATPAPQQGSPSQTDTLLDYLFGDDR